MNCASSSKGDYGLLRKPKNLVRDVDIDYNGMASGVISTVQQVGAALGVVLVGILFGAALATNDGTTVSASAFVTKLPTSR